MKYQPRTRSGQFTKRDTIKIASVIFIFAVFAVWAVSLDNKKEIYTSPFTPQVVEAKDDVSFEEKIIGLKKDVLKKLSTECESKGSPEPDALIIFDSNNQASIGRYQWQIKSVQHWVEVFYGKKIDRREAVLIAMDKGEIDLDEMTMKVMFEAPKGPSEWKNCSTKLNLYTEVALINKLSK